MKQTEKFGWKLGDLRLLKTDKVSMPQEDIWDSLEFEWIEE